MVSKSEFLGHSNKYITHHREPVSVSPPVTLHQHHLAWLWPPPPPPPPNGPHPPSLKRPTRCVHRAPPKSCPVSTCPTSPLQRTQQPSPVSASPTSSLPCAASSPSPHTPNSTAPNTPSTTSPLANSPPTSRTRPLFSVGHWQTQTRASSYTVSRASAEARLSLRRI